jgi:hypothetical protein
MSDPQPARLKKVPRRAEPLQPDRPGRGDAPASKKDDETHSANTTATRSARKLREQGEAARKNVSQGYDD